MKDFNAALLAMLFVALVMAFTAHVRSMFLERRIRMLDSELEAIAAHNDWSYVDGKISPGYHGPKRPKAGK